MKSLSGTNPSALQNRGKWAIVTPVFHVSTSQSRKEAQFSHQFLGLKMSTTVQLSGKPPKGRKEPHKKVHSVSASTLQITTGRPKWRAYFSLTSPVITAADWHLPGHPDRCRALHFYKGNWKEEARRAFLSCFCDP